MFSVGHIVGGYEEVHVAMYLDFCPSNFTCCDKVLAAHWRLNLHVRQQIHLLQESLYYCGGPCSWGRGGGVGEILQSPKQHPQRMSCQDEVLLTMIPWHR